MSAAIISSVNGDGTHGGIVGLNNKVSGKRLIIRGCVFDGQLIGRNTNKCGGFIGWRSGTADIYDSVFDMNKLPNVDNYIQDEGSAMFARNKVDTHNSYYLTVFGTDDANQWKYGYKIDSSWMVKAEFAGDFIV